MKACIVRRFVSVPVIVVDVRGFVDVTGRQPLRFSRFCVIRARRRRRWKVTLIGARPSLRRWRRRRGLGPLLTALLCDCRRAVQE
jgi:hypothetical protein